MNLNIITKYIAKGSYLYVKDLIYIFFSFILYLLLLLLEKLENFDENSMWKDIYIKSKGLERWNINISYSDNKCHAMIWYESFIEDL